MNKKLDIAVDLDGTLARYDGYKGYEHIGEPIKPMVEKVQKWVNQGHKVSIYTARMACFGEHSCDDPAAVKLVIQLWCMVHIGMILPVTNIKGGQDLFFDDRAVEVMQNTGLTLKEHVVEMLEAAMAQSLEEGETYAGSQARQLRDYFKELGDGGRKL